MTKSCSSRPYGRCPRSLGRFATRVVACLVQAVSSGCADDPETIRAVVDRRVGADVAVTKGDDGGADVLGPAPDTRPPEDGSGVSDTAPLPDGAPVDADTDTSGPDVGPTDATGDGSSPLEARLSLPARLAIPWVPADGRSSNLIHRTTFVGPAPTDAQVRVSIGDDSRLSATASIAGAELVLDLRFEGATSLTRAEGTLTVDVGATRVAEATVFAMAGAHSTLPSSGWRAHTADALRYGEEVTVALDTAPFPHPSGSWTDRSVHVFVPDGYTPREAVDFVVHFHGHYATLASTLPDHLYREQLWASGANLVLVVPQGPVSAASGNFGKLMSPDGLVALLDDVSALLYRDGRVTSPYPGDLVLTEHSGGYQATAANLGAVTARGQVMSAHLFDGLYAREADFEAFARDGGFLRSNHTAGGGTRSDNLALLTALGALATDAPSMANLRTRRAVIWPTRAGHNQSTFWDVAFGESLRWAGSRSRQGPRAELRHATSAAGQLRVRWLAPHDDDLEAWRVETSTDGVAFVTALERPADATEASLPMPAGGGVHVRVRPRMADLADDATLPSDSAFVGADPTVLVVDGFDRILGGSWRALTHPAAALVGQAAGAGAMASNEAVADGEVTLGEYAAVIWLLGDESSSDQTFSAAEQSLVSAYLASGGRLIASGSEVAWDLGARGGGSAFLSNLGATYLADDAGATSARGTGALAAVASFAFGGPAALYAEDYPDALNAASGAERILIYPDGRGAAAGVEGRSAVVGFPLELVEGDESRAAVVRALLDFVRP